MDLNTKIGINLHDKKAKGTDVERD